MAMAFSTKKRWKNIQTGEEGRWHLDESLMQRAVKQAIVLNRGAGGVISPLDKM